VPIPTVAAFSAVGEEPYVPVAKTNEPTLTSLIVALAPDLEYVVSAFTVIVAVVPLGPLTVIVSPSSALTRPATLAGTIVIDAATLESVGLATTRTFSPSDSVAEVAPGRRSVSVVAESIEYVDEPDIEVSVIDEPVSAVTSPPMPRGPRAGIGAGADAPSSFEPRAAGGLTGAEGCVDALATPMPLASTVTAIAEERPTFRRTRFRDGCFMGTTFCLELGGFRNRDIFSNECVGAIGTA
jgi:hypothetical protein